MNRLAENPGNCVGAVQADSPEGVSFLGPLPGDVGFENLVGDLIGRKPVRRDRQWSPGGNRRDRGYDAYSGARGLA